MTGEEIALERVRTIPGTSGGYLRRPGSATALPPVTVRPANGDRTSRRVYDRSPVLNNPLHPFLPLNFLPSFG